MHSLKVNTFLENRTRQKSLRSFSKSGARAWQHTTNVNHDLLFNSPLSRFLPSIIATAPLPWEGQALSEMIYSCLRIIRRDLIKLVEPVVQFQLGQAPEGIAPDSSEHTEWLLQRIRDLRKDCAFADPYGSPPFGNEAFWQVIRTYLWAGLNKFAVAYPDDFKEGVPEHVLSTFLTIVSKLSL